MSELIATVPSAEDIEVSFHGETRKMFEPTAARCTTTTVPCCCCCD